MTGRDARAYLARHDRATFTARVTGRRTFGQLWMADPTIDIIMRAFYLDDICAQLNNVTPLSALFAESR